MKGSNKALENHIAEYSRTGPARLACFWPGGIHLIENASRRSPSLITNATSCACPMLPRGCQSCWCPGSTMEAPWAPGWPMGYEEIRDCFLGSHYQCKFHVSDPCHPARSIPWKFGTFMCLLPHANTHFTGLPSASVQAMTLGPMEVLFEPRHGQKSFKVKIPQQLMSLRQLICTCNQHIETCWGLSSHASRECMKLWRPYTVVPSTIQHLSLFT